MQFTWDQRKDRVNQRKHGISFATAILVFDDPGHVSVQDREADGEARWQTIGMVSGVRVVVVAHTVDEDEEGIRIISARKATPSERNIYVQAK